MNAHRKMKRSKVYFNLAPIGQYLVLQIGIGLSKVKIRIVFIFSRQISAKVCPSKIFHKYRFFFWESILV